MEFASAITLQSVSLLVVAAIVYITRKRWSEWIAQQVRGDVEERLEKLKSGLRDSEGEFSAFREGAMANLKNTQALLAQRRIKAVDDLWSSVEEWSKFQGTILAIAWITDESFMAALQRGDAEHIDLAEVFLESAPTNIEGVGASASSARPYVSDFAWALYIAYFSVFAYAVMVAKVFKPRQAKKAKLPLQALDNILTKALPDMADYIKSSGVVGHYHLTDVLRTRLLAELRSTLGGKEQDAESIARAAAVGNALSELREEQAKVALAAK